MRKNNTTMRALKLYHSFNPKFFPTKTFVYHFCRHREQDFVGWLNASNLKVYYSGLSYSNRGTMLRMEKL